TPSKIPAGASASGAPAAEAELRTAWLRGWRLGRQQTGYRRACVHPLFVHSRQARSGKAMANSNRPAGKPTPDDERGNGQQYAQKHRVPGMPRPSEIRLIGDERQEGDDRTYRD